MKQSAERGPMNRCLTHRRKPAVDLDGVDPERGPLVAQPRARNKGAQSGAGAMEPVARQPGNGCARTLAAISAIARTGPAISE